MSRITIKHVENKIEQINLLLKESKKIQLEHSGINRRGSSYKYISRIHELGFTVIDSTDTYRELYDKLKCYEKGLEDYVNRKDVKNFNSREN